MLKVNDCCWAAGTDPENKYVSKKLGEKQNLPYSKTLEKRKKFRVWNGFEQTDLVELRTVHYIYYGYQAARILRI